MEFDQLDPVQTFKVDPDYLHGAATEEEDAPQESPVDWGAAPTAKALRARLESQDFVPDDVPPWMGVSPSSLYSKEKELADIARSKADLPEWHPGRKEAEINLRHHRNFVMKSDRDYREKAFREFDESQMTAEEYAAQKGFELHKKILPGFELAPMRMLYEAPLAAGGSWYSLLARATGHGDVADDAVRSVNALRTAEAVADQNSLLGPDWTRRTRGVTTNVFRFGTTGGAGGLPAMVADYTATGTNEGYVEAIDAGLNESQAVAYGLFSGAITGATTLIGSLIPGVKSVEGVVKDLVKGAAVTTLKRGVTNAMLSGGVEVLEEGTDALGQLVLQKAFELDPNALTPDNVVDVVGEAMLQAGMTAGVVEAGRAGLRSMTAPPKPSEGAQQAFKDHLDGRLVNFETDSPSRKEFSEKVGGEKVSSQFRKDYAQTARAIEGNVVSEDMATQGESGGQRGSLPDIAPHVLRDHKLAKIDMLGREYLRPLPLEESVHLIKSLVGEVPKVASLHSQSGFQNLGTFRRLIEEDGTQVYKGILLNQEIDNPEIMLKVLSHEMGHLADWLDDKTLKRGGLGGRIAAMNPMLDKHARRALQEEIGVKNKELKGELVRLSEWWSPYDKSILLKPEEELTDHDRERLPELQRYQDYRESGKELFAEFMSVFFNSPGDAQARAPQTFSAYMRFLNKRPKFAHEYLKVQQMLDGTPEEIVSARIDRAKKQFERADVKLAMMFAEQEQKERGIVGEALFGNIDMAKEKFGDLADETVRTLVDYMQPLTAHKKAIKAREGDAGVRDMEKAIDSFMRASVPVEILFSDVSEKVVDPLLAEGIDKETFGNFLRATDIVLNRKAKLANPQGWTKETAGRVLNLQKEQLGPEKYKLLSEKALELRKIFRDRALTPYYESGLISEEKYQELYDNWQAYSPIEVTEYMGRGASSSIIARKGGWADEGNPLTSTVRKAHSMILAAEYNKFKRYTVDTFNDFGTPFVKKEKGSHVEKDETVIGVSKDGKKAEYIVPKKVATMFDGPDTWPLVKMFSTGMYKVFYPLYITLRSSFAAMNVPRDMFRTWQLLNSESNRQRAGYIPFFTKLVPEYIKALPEAFSFAKGEHLVEKYRNPNRVTARQAHEARAIDHRAVSSARYKSAGPSEQEIDAIARKYGYRPENHGIVLRTLKKLGDTPIINLPYLYYGKGLPAVINTTEAASKLAGFQIAKDLGMSDEDAADVVRTNVGTPNTRRRGAAGDLLNSFRMFATARLANLRTHYDLATSKGSRGPYWMITGSVLGTTGLVMKAAEEGMLGSTLQEMMALISDDEKRRKFIIPMGITEDSDGNTKAIYGSIPKDHDLAAMSAVLDYAWDFTFEKDPDALSSMAAEVLDHTIGAPSPPLELAGRWMEFASNRLPMDSFYDSPVMREAVFEEGGYEAWSKMISWSFGKLGAAADPVSTAVRIGDEGATKENVVRSVPFLGALIRVSDRGVSEAEWEAIQEKERDSARPGRMVRRNDGVDKIMRERSRLIRLGDALKEEDYHKKARYQWFHRHQYEPARKSIKSYLAQDMPDKAEQVASQVGKVGEIMWDYWRLVDAGQAEKAKELLPALRGALTNGQDPR